jgi:flagella basal body P-ring formation protein FlgA
VIAEGEAQQDGRVGQTIRVVNRESKKVVTGRVSGPGVVDVEAGGAP